MIFNSPKSILGFDDRLLALIGVALNTHTVMAIYYTSAFFKVPFGIYIVRWSGELLAVSALWFVIRWLYLILLKKYPGLKNQKKRFLIIPFFLIPYFLISIFYIYEIQPYFDWNLEEFPEPLVAVRIITGIVIFFVDIGVYEAMHLFVELKDSRIKQERLRKEKLTAELMMLKNQLNPHFLFNSLTTLLYLIDTNSEKAKDFVHKLSTIYKDILRDSDENLITLDKEIQNISVYSDLLMERYSKNLNIAIDVGAEHLNKLIVPFSLQIGVENAVKHNVLTNKRPLDINVSADNDYIFIENPLQLKKKGAQPNGVGLKNIVERYKVLSIREVIVEENEDSFLLKIPLIDAGHKVDQITFK